MTDQPTLTVIIPVWNGVRYIRAGLAALAAQTAPSDQFQVIVVGNGSTDGTAGILAEFPNVLSLFEPQPGSYRARNLALKHARGDFLLFTDADCVPRADWIASALGLAGRDEVEGVTGGRICLFREGRGNSSAAAFEELTSFNQAEYIAAERCVTANWLCSKRVLESVGGFNAELLSGGDFDCARRIAAAGHPIRYAPEMVVEHPIRADVSELVAKRRRVVGGMWVMDGLKDQSFPRTLSSLTKNGLRQLRSVMRSNLDAGMKPGVLVISFVLTAVSVLEATRLRLGAAPYRS